MSPRIPELARGHTAERILQLNPAYCYLLSQHVHACKCYTFASGYVSQKQVRGGSHMPLFGWYRSSSNSKSL